MLQKLKDKLLPIIFLVIGYFYDIWWLIRYGSWFSDSDMASEMILAALENTNHSFVEKNWFYSSALRVVDMQLFYRIGLWITPDNWHVARVIGMAIAIALLACLCYFVACFAGVREHALWLAGMSIWPVGFWYHWQTLFGGYYLAHTLIIMVSLCALLGLWRASGKVSMIFTFASLVLMAFLSGLQGMRHALIFFAPLLLTGLVFYKERKLLIGSIGAFLGNVVGFLVNILVLEKIYTFATTEKTTWGHGTGSWLKSLGWFFEMFGFCQNYVMGMFDLPQDIPVLSFNGIAVGIGWCLGTSILISAIYLLIRYRRLKEGERFLVTLTFFMLFTTGFLFTYVGGAMQYWQQTVPFGYILLLIAICRFREEELFTKKKSVTGLTTLFACAIVICSIGATTEYVKLPFRCEANLKEVVTFILEKTDYKVGYAPFWQCNYAVELSNGKLDMLCADGLPNSLEVRQWLQRKDHVTNPPESHFFIILDGGFEMYGTNEFLDSIGAKYIYDDGRYCVLGVQ